ncbi:MAG: YajQ family cyclic di-GMP-binding protein [Clostridium sp.]
MASTYSFDVVSQVDMQEVDNAVNQALKEISNRYDFKGCKAEIQVSKNEIKIAAEDDFKLTAIKEILSGKFSKRGISPKAINYDKKADASLGTVRQSATIVNGLSMEQCKEITQEVKASKLKIQAQINDDKVKIISKDKDTLQEAIQLIKSKDFDFPIQFNNYR